MRKTWIAFVVLMAAVAQGFNLPVARRDVLEELKELSDVSLECKEKPVELGIVLDTSKSIWILDFIRAIKFLQDLVSYFDIGSTKTRVALITFGDGIHKDKSFNLNTYTTKEELLEAISKIPHTFDKHTGTALGIDYMRDVQLGEDKVRSNANKIAVVITDGNSQNKEATAESAAKAQADGIKMIAVGVGNKVNDQELENIAAGNQNRVIRTRKYSQLKNILEPLREKICEPVTPAPPIIETPVTLPSPTEPPKDEPFGKGPFELTSEQETTPAIQKTSTTLAPTMPPPKEGHLGAVYDEHVCEDVHIELGIVLDSSSSIWPPDFERAKEFLEDLVGAFDIGPDKTRVALILFGDGIYTEEAFNLTTYISETDIKAAIGNIEHKGGAYTSTGQGIDFMREQLASQVVRPGHQKVAVVITDGNSQEGDETASAAARAVKDGIYMIAVGIGDRVNDKELENIAGGNSSRVIRATKFSQIMNVLGPLRTKICKPNASLPVARRAVLGDLTDFSEESSVNLPVERKDVLEELKQLSDVSNGLKLFWGELKHGQEANHPDLVNRPQAVLGGLKHGQEAKYPDLLNRPQAVLGRTQAWARSQPP
ncbi:hypothetical protein RRG08_055951 [Elysia crispata]|uniref:VWFA domain-containing protein n=1 Tax=Elysia crispata TaxID=231223 RepID=A0AAE1DZF2_9GAST|nr:hypothetical protein RRG08_055951 [Elysia crispata]